MRKSQIVGATLIILSAAVVGAAFSIARGPDYEIELTRRIPSKLSTPYLDQAWNLLSQWPAWFFTCVSVKEVDANGKESPKADQKLEKGRYVRFDEDGKHGLNDRYSLTAQITDYVPQKKLEFHVVADSGNRLARLFDSLDWTIELLPNGSGSWIKGKAVAHTHGWRARILGRIAPKVLLNQVYYPNLFVLAEINNPDVVAPNPEDQHGGM